MRILIGRIAWIALLPLMVAVAFLLDGAPPRAADGPRIFVNQHGYLPDGPKRATVASASVGPLAFEVVDKTGQVAFSGRTEPRGFDTSAGLEVHIADFSEFTGTGDGFVLRVSDGASYPFAIRGGLYRDLRTDALGYFYLARSGIEIDAALVGEAYARPAGHVSSPADGARNKGDRDVPCQPAEVSLRVYGEPWTCDYTLSPVGGWYDAGDHGKYVVNGGIAVAQLLSAYEWALRLGTADTLGDAALAVPEAGNGVPDILDEARWELDFFARMIVPEGDPLAGMVHHKLHDDAWTSPPLLPHRADKRRKLHRPSTAATLNAAATFAQAARLFEPYDPAYAGELRDHASSAWTAALRHPEIYATPEDGQSGGGPYDDRDVADEFFWAAAELFITTGDVAYLERLRASRFAGGGVFVPRGFDWNYVAPHAWLQLALHAERLPDADAVRTALVAHAESLAGLSESNPFGHAYAPPGGNYQWGSSHLVIQNGILLAAAFELTGDRRFRNAAIEAVDYVLGRNAMANSYVTGYGTVYSRNQHSRWFANQVDPALPNPPKGSLSGGPNSDYIDPVAKKHFAQTGCAPQACYVDDIESWSTNEITINWNAALVQFASWLAAQ
ncbi:glycoside hydrolase family 9 protein [Oricola sp.]|uniref:glycoside hydrolase family 9 protein n=1 Tax=Oricola sp. TaxID=1979950 RepID=UPI003BA97010